MKTFTITDKEWNIITEWQNKHIKEKTSGAIDDQFTPTTIGAIGIYRCNYRNSFIFLGI